MAMDRQRIQTPDLLKGLAVILMVQVHIMELFVKADITEGPAGTISLFLGGVPAAPVFMIVMGYFLAFRQKSPSQLMTRGLKLFMAGMLLNIGLNAHLIIKVIFFGWGASVNIWPYIFGVDILHLAGLSLLVIGILSSLFKNSILPWPGVIVAILVLPYFIAPYSGDIPLVQYLLAFVYSNSSWSYFPLFPWLAYPLAGYSFHRIEKIYAEKSFSVYLKTSVFLVLLMFTLLTLNYGAAISRALPAYYHHGAPFFLWAIAFVAWWSILARAVEHTLGKTPVLRFIKWLGVHVTTVYIIQWLIIGNMATAVYKTLSLHTSALWFVVILIFTSVLTYSWNKIKKRYALNFLSL